MKKKRQDIKPEIRINVRVPRTEKDELKQVGELSGLSETLIVRHAVKKTLVDIRKQIDAGKGVAIVI